MEVVEVADFGTARAPPGSWRVARRRRNAESSGRPAQYTRSLDGGPWVSSEGWAVEGPRSVRGARRCARPVERHPAIAKRNVRVVPDDEVVQQLDVEESSGRERLGGEVQVVR